MESAFESISKAEWILSTILLRRCENSKGNNNTLLDVAPQSGFFYNSASHCLVPKEDTGFSLSRLSSA